MSNPRERHASVWCARWLSPDCPRGVDTPGYRGGGEVELCESCEAKRVSQLLADVGEVPDPVSPTPLETTRDPD